MFQTVTPNSSVRGTVTLYGPNGETLLTQPNQLQYDWGFVAAKCVGQADVSFAVRYMYVEYENVASSGTAVTLPTNTRSDGFDYYQGLSASSTRDFLRVPLISRPAVGTRVGGDSTFRDYFGTDTGRGNQVSFLAQTAGTVGFHGKPYSEANNSKIYGIALVAAPVSADPTADLVFARTYFASGSQKLKLPNYHFTLGWDIEFL